MNLHLCKSQPATSWEEGKHSLSPSLPVCTESPNAQDFFGQAGIESPHFQLVTQGNFFFFLLASAVFWA